MKLSVSRKVFLAAFVLTFLSSGAPFAQVGCTMIGCVSGLTINFDDGKWLPGEYHFDLIADGTAYHCQGSLPFRSCENNVICDREGIMIGESGCAMPPETHGFFAVMMEEIPGSISLTVKHESGREYQFSSGVEPQCGYPNGKECDIEPCCSAVLNQKLEWK